MEIGPEPRRPCDFPGQPAHQNGPRSRPMGMGRAFSCPFLGNSSAPRGAAGARSALKSPGGGFRPPPGDFRLPGPGALGPGPPNAAAPLRTHRRPPRPKAVPAPSWANQPASRIRFSGKAPAGNSAFRPCSRAFGQQPLGRVRRAAGLGLPCLGWRRGGRRRLAARGPKAPGPAKQKERAPGPALLGRFAPCRRPPGAIPGRAALGFLQRRQGQKPQVFANELQGKGVAGGE